MGKRNATRVTAKDMQKAGGLSGFIKMVVKSAVKGDNEAKETAAHAATSSEQADAASSELDEVQAELDRVASGIEATLAQLQEDAEVEQEMAEACTFKPKINDYSRHSTNQRPPFEDRIQEMAKDKNVHGMPSASGHDMIRDHKASQ